MGLSKFKDILKDKDYQEYLFNKLFLETLSKYGISKDDLVYLPEALKQVKEMRNNIDEMKLANEKKAKEIVEKQEENSISDYINSFSGSIEEFRPYGK